MKLFLDVLLAAIVMASSWWLTGRYRTKALQLRILDVPNERSSHHAPTPRGGGVGFVVTSLIGFLALGISGRMNWSTICGLGGGGLPIALVGFLDDRKQIPAHWRLLAHLLASTWVIVWLGGAHGLRHVFDAFGVAWLSWPIGILYLGWMLNLTNFMDGIDGLAAVEGVIVLFCGSLLAIACGMEFDGAFPAGLLGAAVLGFLVWNWPPAKIFMGDVGSGYLGLLLGAFSLQAGTASPKLFWAWLVLLGVFVVDASTTLLVRFLRGEKISEAHRNHAYQHAVQRWGSHARVTVAVTFINVLWLLPLAYLVASGAVSVLTGLSIAYLPLTVAALLLGAGTPFRGRAPVS